MRVPSPHPRHGESENAGHRTRGADKAAIALVGGLTLVVFGGVVLQGWIQFDDPVNVIDNPHFFPLTWLSVGELWRRPYEFLYIPVSYMLFAAECLVTRLATGGGPCSLPHPGLFHAVSLGLHILNGLTVYRLLGRLLPERWMAAAGAAVFTLHPLQVESVAWISEQRGLLAAFCALLAVETFLGSLEDQPASPVHRGSYVLAILLFAAAVLAKPAAVTTPLIALALGVHRGTQTPRRVAMMLMPWFALAALMALGTRVSQPVDHAAVPVALVERPLIAADAIAWYATKVVAPVGLCVGYGRTPAVVLACPTTPLVAVATAVAIGVIFFTSRFRVSRLPAALFLSPLLPVLGLVSFRFQLQSTVADRYAYVAMLGPASAVGMLLSGCGSPPARQRALGLTVSGVIALAGLSLRQTATWHDTGTLARHACAVSPGVATSWVLAAADEIAKREPERAVAASRRGLEIDQRNFQGWINLGCGLALGGHQDEAEMAFARARDVAASPRQRVELETNLGRLLLDTGRNVAAAEAFRAALADHPRHVAARLGLGIALTRCGEPAMAIDLFRGILEDQPRCAEAWVGLGNAHFISGRPLEAVNCYGHALRIDPSDAATLANRARAWLAAGELSGAGRDVEMLRTMGYPVAEDLAAALEETPGANREAAEAGSATTRAGVRP